MASSEPQSGTDNFEENEPRSGTDKDIEKKPRSGTDNNENESRNGTDIGQCATDASAFNFMIEFQLKQMEFMKNFSQQFRLTNDEQKESLKRRNDSDKECEPPQKQCRLDQMSECSADLDDLDNIIRNVEHGDDTSAVTNDAENDNLQEVNESMNEMVEFYDDSEKRGDAIDDTLSKTVNTFSEYFRIKV
jgi:predicted transglutaminase-like cysteine proteinase